MFSLRGSLCPSRPLPWLYCEGQWLINFNALKLTILLLHVSLGNLSNNDDGGNKNTKRKPNKQTNKQKQSLCTCIIYFFIVVYKTSTSNNQIQGFEENRSTVTVNFSYSFFSWMLFHLIYCQERLPHCTKLQGGSNNVNTYFYVMIFLGSSCHGHNLSFLSL